MRVYGKNVCLEIIGSNEKVYKAWLCSSYNDKKVISTLQKQGIPIEYLTIKELNKIEKGNHQGIILDIAPYQYFPFLNLIESLNKRSFILVLDHLEDPHNLGAIIRTAVGVGVDAIIIPKDRCAKVNATVVKVSAGAAMKIKICQVANINEALRKLKQAGFWIVGSDAKAEVSFYQAQYTYPLALVVGNEGKGINGLTKRICDFSVNIPLVGGINSLNVSVATGILIYQIIINKK